MDLAQRYNETDIAIIQGLEPLLQEAERKGLWLVSHYQQIWFSPQQLRTHLANGKYLWGPPNWELRYPSERPMR